MNLLEIEFLFLYFLCLHCCTVECKKNGLLNEADMNLCPTSAFEIYDWTKYLISLGHFLQQCRGEELKQCD